MIAVGGVATSVKVMQKYHRVIFYKHVLFQILARNSREANATYALTRKRHVRNEEPVENNQEI